MEVDESRQVVEVTMGRRQKTDGGEEEIILE